MLASRVALEGAHRQNQSHKFYSTSSRGLYYKALKFYFLQPKLHQSIFLKHAEAKMTRRKKEHHWKAHPWCSTTALSLGGRQELGTKAGRHIKRALKALGTCKNKPQARLSILILSKTYPTKEKALDICKPLAGGFCLPKSTSSWSLLSGYIFQFYRVV